MGENRGRGEEVGEKRGEGGGGGEEGSGGWGVGGGRACLAGGPVVEADAAGGAHRRPHARGLCKHLALAICHQTIHARAAPIK